MKKQIILLAAITMAFTSTLTVSAYAGDRMIVKIEKAEAPKAVNLQLSDLDSKRTNITLFAANGVNWFSETVTRQNTYATQLNLAGMPVGDYVIVIDRKGSQYVQAMSLDNDIIFFETPERDESQRDLVILTSNGQTEKGKLITHFTQERGQKIGVRVANLMEQSAHIQLVEPNGGVALTQSVRGENGYGVKWDLAGMRPGYYFLYINAADATVIQFFELDDNSVVLTSQQRVDRVEKTGPAVITAR